MQAAQDGFVGIAGSPGSQLPPETQKRLANVRANPANYLNRYQLGGTAMKDRSDRVRRWASLSALASAALAASSGSGEAAIIFHQAGGVGPNAFLPLPGNNQISMTRLLFGAGGASDSTHFSIIGPKGHFQGIGQKSFFAQFHSGTVNLNGVSFRKSRGAIALTGKGRTFNQVGSGVGFGRLANLIANTTNKFAQGIYLYGPHPRILPPWSRRNYNASNTYFRQKVRVHTNASLTHHGTGNIRFYQTKQSTRYDLPARGNQFALFRFDIGAQTDYGWLELGLGNLGDRKPFIRAIGYAYDTTGKPIKAGAVPEPQHLPLALSALALGAIGVREWRKKRGNSTV
jgi:hypothetical protein